MKKLLGAILCIGLCLGLAACSGDDSSDNGSGGDSGAKQEDTGETKKMKASIKFKIDGTNVNVTITSEDLDFSTEPWVAVMNQGSYQTAALAKPERLAYTTVTEENFPEVVIDASGVEPGRYLLGLCASEADDGKMLASTAIEIK